MGSYYRKPQIYLFGTTERLIKICLKFCGLYQGMHSVPGGKGLLPVSPASLWGGKG